MRSHVIFVLCALVLATSSLSGCEDKAAGAQAPQAQGVAVSQQTCEHGVQKALCARCNPKLEPVFRAKGDWCEEHARPESQCALCNADVAKAGVK